MPTKGGVRVRGNPFLTLTLTLAHAHAQSHTLALSHPLTPVPRQALVVVMKQNPTIPTVLAYACAALSNIAGGNPENGKIAGAAGAVQVHVSASSYPTTI